MSDALERLGAALAEHYAIERQIGAGGMATVYLARDLKHDRSVALKVLRPELAAVLGAERFLREIAVTARLDFCATSPTAPRVSSSIPVRQRQRCDTPWIP